MPEAGEKAGRKLPMWIVGFDADAAAPDEEQADRLVRAVRAAEVRHLIVLAHAAHNDEETADRVHDRWRALLEEAGCGEGVGLVAVRWPGMCFAPAEEGHRPRVTDADLAALRRVFPGGDKVLTGLRDLLDARPQKNGALDDLGIGLRRLSEQPLDDPLHAYGTDLGADVLPQTDPAMLIDSPAQVCEGFAEALEWAQEETARVEEREPERFEEPDGSEAHDVSEHGTLTETDTPGPRPPDDPTECLERPESLAPSERPLRAAESGPELARKWDGAHQLLCQVTSYAVRRHAGLIGERGLAPLLRHLRAELPDTRLHLVGHGPGARLVAYAARGLDTDEPPIASLCLFQAAVSHFAFADHLPQLSGGGALAGLDGRVAGPVVCTYSHHDLELGLFFPLACRRIGDGALLSGAGRMWGALGYDGVQGIDGSPTLTLADALTEGALPDTGYVSVDASEVVREGGPPQGAHHDVHHPHLAHLIRTAGRLP
ncbi:hypothetical protein GCM10018785_58110 [Streptomyces longispororuber]|uniref:Serine-threonine protein kinase n=1 Tax=Streptomyces longispororuber TaxID=68230 RepID=A0A919DT92_9ACTN|nr:hypothetical protein [Streptomyces longispororuber]GHE82428.1 hypothetical protein GCM10018785_58110 [Streptomyces longispororuber]